MQYYNIHSHIFTLENAPQDFLQLYVPKFIAKGLDKITNSQLGASAFSRILNLIPTDPTRRYASFLKIGKSKNQLEVFKELFKQYDDENMKLIALTMYMEKCGVETSVTGFEGQIEGILRVKKEYPDKILIFFGLDPRWKGTSSEIRKTVESYFEKKLQINERRTVYPFTGLKIYPSTGFYPFDKNLKETFEWAADNGVPVMSHCSYLGGLFNNDRTYISGNLNSFDVYADMDYSRSKYLYKKNAWKWALGINTAFNNQNNCSFFMEPNSYDSLLLYFDKKPNPLKLCLAHFGGGSQMLDAELNNDSKKPCYGVKGKNWHVQIQEMMVKYKSLYTDISYSISDIKLHKYILKELNNKSYGDRIMFGTDFFMTERVMAEKQIYQKFKNFCINESQTNLKGKTWDMVAGYNVENFLKSKYYNGEVI